MLFTQSSSSDINQKLTVHQWQENSNSSSNLLPLSTMTTNYTKVDNANETYDFQLSCLHYGQHLLNTSVLSVEGTKRWMFDLTLSISVFALATSLVIYLIVHELRTVPGKCLMGLITSELLFNITILVSIFLQHHDYVGTIPCFIVSLVMHYFLLSIILWSNIIGKIFL